MSILFLMDREGNILVSSATGLDKMIFQNGQTPKIERNIFSGSVNNLLEDDHERLWLATLRGLIRYDPQTQQVQKYDMQDGLLSTEFGGDAYKSSRSGELFFGTENGLLYFHPDSIKSNPYIPPVVISSLSYYNTRDPSSPPVHIENIHRQSEIRFPYYQNTLVIKFAALSYNKSSKNQYAYRFWKIIHLGSNWVQSAN